MKENEKRSIDWNMIIMIYDTDCLELEVNKLQLNWDHTMLSRFQEMIRDDDGNWNISLSRFARICRRNKLYDFLFQTRL